MSNSEHVDTQSSEHLIGRVKWFNNKAGYGFITVTDGPRAGSDIFTHHSAINVENQQYKYLVQGEYVNFDLVSTNSGAHEFQASSVNGINGGKLMCETRREFKLSRSNYKSEKGDPAVATEVQTPVPQRVPRPRVEKSSQKPREGEDEERKDWTVVSKTSTEKKGRGRPAKAKAVSASVSGDV